MPGKVRFIEKKYDLPKMSECEIERYGIRQIEKNVKRISAAFFFFRQFIYGRGDLCGRKFVCTFRRTGASERIL